MRTLVILLFTMVYFVGMAETFVFDYPYCSISSNGSVVPQEHQENNNAYRIQWIINDSNISIKISEVKIDAMGNSTIVKNIDSMSFNVKSRGMTLYNYEDSFEFGNSLENKPYWKQEMNGYARVRGMSGKHYTVFEPQLGVFLYFESDGPQWKTRTETYHKNESLRLHKALKKMPWNKQQ